MVTMQLTSLQCLSYVITIYLRFAAFSASFATKHEGFFGEKNTSTSCKYQKQQTFFFSHGFGGNSFFCFAYRGGDYGIGL